MEEDYPSIKEVKHSRNYFANKVRINVSVLLRVISCISYGKDSGLHSRKKKISKE